MTDSGSKLLTAERLEVLASALRERGFPIVERLRPGLTEVQMDALTGPLGLSLPVEARVWWGWHDGATAAGPATIGPGWWFAPLATCVDSYRELRDIATQPDLHGIEWWPPTWFPIVQGGWALACDTDVAPDQPTPIRAWYLEDGAPREPSLRSLGALIEMWIDVLRAGAWQYHPEIGGALEHPEHLPQGRRPFGLP